eukprot:4864286-Pyramimonas_sp.AAC.1
MRCMSGRSFFGGTPAIKKSGRGEGHATIRNFILGRPPWGLLHSATAWRGQSEPLISPLPSAMATPPGPWGEAKGNGRDPAKERPVNGGGGGVDEKRSKAEWQKEEVGG